MKSSKLENNKSAFSDGLEQFKNKYIINKGIPNNKGKLKLIKSKNSSSSLEPNNNEEELSNSQIDNESNNTHFHASEINEEIYPGEVFIIPNKGENLLNKKLSFSELEKNEKIIENNNSFNENSKHEFLLESIRGIKSYKENYNSLEKIQNNLNDIFSKKSNKRILLKLNKQLNEKNENHNTNLSIESDIKIEILSIYDNINKLSNFRFYNNESLQLKVKNIVQKKSDELSFSSSRNDYDIFQPNNNKKGNKSVKSIINLSSINKTKAISSGKLPFVKEREKSLISNNNRSFIHNNNLFIKKKSKNIINKRKNIFIKIGRKFNDELDSELKRSKKFSRTKVYSAIFNSNNNTNVNNSSYLNRKYTQANRMGISNKKKENSKILNNKTLLIPNNDYFKKRKNGSLLSKINLNIEKTNQNLNNPDEFYSNYFQSLLEGEDKNMDKDEKKNF